MLDAVNPDRPRSLEAVEGKGDLDGGEVRTGAPPTFSSSSSSSQLLSSTSEREPSL